MERTAIARDLSKLPGQIALTVLLIFVNLLLIGPADGATYYVATNGNDSNPGTISQPFRTVGKGTSALKPGDALYLRAGTYDAIIGGWDIPAGSPGQHTMIAGYAKENPTIRCTNCGAYAIVNLGLSYITAQDFTIDGINGGVDGVCAYLGSHILFTGMTCLNAPRDGLRVVGENTIIRNSHIKDCGRVQTHPLDTKGLGIHANSDGGGSTTTNLLIENNLIEGCRAGGIGVQQQPETRDVIVRNNILRNFGTYSRWPQAEGSPPQSGTGINFAHGSNFYAYNNLVYGIRGAGSDCFLAWGGGLGRPNGRYFYFYNNTCHDTETGIVMWNETNNITARNNIFSNVDRVESLGNGAGNINMNYVTVPLFLNPAAGDFKLQSGSPGIDQGANLSTLFTTDMAGVTRPQNGAFDIGAYEYIGTTASVIMLPSSPVNVRVIGY